MVKELTKETFEKAKQASKPILVDFWASWCGPCKMLTPIFNELSQEMSEQLDFAKISTEDYPDVAQENEISSIPCMIMFKEGKEIERIIGFKAKPALKQEIEKLLEKA